MMVGIDRTVSRLVSPHQALSSIVFHHDRDASEGMSSFATSSISSSGVGVMVPTATNYDDLSGSVPVEGLSYRSPNVQCASDMKSLWSIKQITLFWLANLSYRSSCRCALLSHWLVGRSLCRLAYVTSVSLSTNCPKDLLWRPEVPFIDDV